MKSRSKTSIIEIMAATIHNCIWTWSRLNGEHSMLNWQMTGDRMHIINEVKDYLEKKANKKKYTAKQWHTEWYESSLKDGWDYAPIANANKKLHPYMVPYDELPAYAKMKSIIFVTLCDKLSTVETMMNSAEKAYAKEVQEKLKAEKEAKSEIVESTNTEQDDSVH